MSVLCLRDTQWRRLPRGVKVPVRDILPLVQARRRNGAIEIRRRAKWIIGRYHLGHTTVEVPSPVGTSTLLPLVLFATGATPRTLQDLSGHALDGTGTAFHTDIARVFLRCVRGTLGHDFATRFTEITETGYTLRGKPVWSKMVGRAPGSGVVCRSFSRTTDHVLNQLIASGIDRAACLLVDSSECRAESHALSRIWHAIASPVTASQALFDDAYRRLGPLTERYRVPLKLAEMLLLRLQPDPFHGGESFGPGCALNLADLLERIVYQLLRTYLERYPFVSVEFQHRDQHCFVDAEGRKYRSVRPDIILSVHDKPAAVLDTKFKPYYTEARADGSLPSSRRVSTADLFQVAFYQTRLQSRYKLACPPVPCIVAPQLSQNAPALNSRIVRWLGAGSAVEARVLPVPLSALAHQLRTRESHGEIIDVVPELKALADYVATAHGQAHG